MRLYLDANAIIYAIEGAAPLRRAALAWIERGRGPEGQVLTSRLSRLECLSKPMAAGDVALMQRHEGLFQALRLVEVTPDTIEHALALRARFNLRSMDALHLAAAIREGVDAFLTNDGRLKRCTDLNVVSLSD